MRVGTLAYSTDQGIGILARSFYQHEVVTDVFVVNHAHHGNHGEEWYPNSPKAFIRDLTTPVNICLLHEFCVGMQVMLFFETPFVWDLIPYCRQHGVKTALVTMYECYPERMLKDEHFWPDLFLCPSDLDLKYFPPSRSLQVKIPVDIDLVKWRQRTTANVFVHNAGHGGLRGRNGTRELLGAMKYVKSPLTLILRTQEAIKDSMGDVIPTYTDPRIRVYNGTLDYKKLWTEGGVFVFPDKFSGLSLPLQEARAAGMLVMALDRFPLNQWLPSGPLIPVDSYNKARVGSSYLEFDEAVVSPRAIAETMDRWYGRDIESYSLSGREWADKNSWEALKPRYVDILQDLVLPK